jgi:hypothetical protein
VAAHAECAGMLDGGSHTAAVVTRESLTADEMAGLKPTCSVFGDFLEIFSKWYAATVPIAVGYLTRRYSAQPLSSRPDDTAHLVAAFPRGVSENGVVEGLGP